LRKGVRRIMGMIRRGMSLGAQKLGKWGASQIEIEGRRKLIEIRSLEYKPPWM
jgi:hypothetical protein